MNISIVSMFIKVLLKIKRKKTSSVKEKTIILLKKNRVYKGNF